MERRLDPTPFEARMPAPVRDLVDRARRGDGPLVRWLAGGGAGWGAVGDCFGLLRGHPEVLPAEVVGWIVGMTTFVDDLHALPGVMDRERRTGPAAGVLEAFAAGVAAGLPTLDGQWRSIDRIAVMAGDVPDTLLDVLVVAVASDRALDRSAGLRLAQRAGDRASAALTDAAKRAEGAAARRIRTALDTLAGGNAQGEGAITGVDARLLQLRAAWEASYDPSLAEALGLLGRDVDRPHIAGDSVGEREVAWHAIADRCDPLDVHRLLSTPWPAKWKEALARVDALAPFPPDPRIGRAFLQLADRYGSLGSHPLHLRAAAVAGRHLDGSLADEVRRAASVSRSAAPYGRLEAVCRGRPRTEPPPEAGRIADALLDAEAERAQLWEAVYDDPDDTAALLVLADALQSIGDPRGELMALQHAEEEGRADAATRRRIKQLLADHADTWTGPIPGVTRSQRVFRRGLLTAVRISTGGASLSGSAHLPAWRTVEHLVVDDTTTGLDGLLPHVPRLHTLVASFWGADGLEGPFPGIATFGICGRPDIDRFARLFPNARTVLATWASSYDVQAAAVRRRVDEAAGLGLSVVLVATKRDAVPALLRALQGSSRAVTLELSEWKHTHDLERPGWRLVLEPDGSASLGHVGARWDLAEGRRHLRLLAEVSGQVTVDVPGPDRRRAELVEALEAN